ncbi:heavy metal-binding protein HIP-like [Ostrea edulis]|uniref:heavy metal-binding protein HIP-like n=1 Tax=Ostrea edulis TaxID=37623 RepID=UPI0024AED792|nr:heavy metal-binding protein HIP-like [Ostrea edulis]
MVRMLMLRVTLVLMILLTELYGNETTQDFISKYNKYNTVCRGMGYERKSCKGRYHGMHMLILRRTNTFGSFAFHARTSSTLQNLGSYAVVVFGKVTLNSGSAYNGNTGIFTAPTDGIYSFTWTILTKMGSYLNTHIVINGHIVGYNNVDGKAGSAQYEASSTTTVIRMKKKDKVWIRAYNREAKYAYKDFSSFSGFQL